jgi:CHAD domain-containing protein
LQSVLRQFALRDDDGPQAPRVPELPGSPFAVRDPARSVTLRRLWLDTFDWRLYRSGLTLEQVTSRGSTEIVLTGRDGTVLGSHEEGRQRQGGVGPAAGGGRPAWPGTLDVLPPGPLRDHLSPVVGVRALLPVARAVSTVRENRVLNSDEKTVARLTVDRMSVTYPAAGTAAPRLRVTPLRGYQAQALKLADLLAEAPGVTDGGPSGLEAALAVAGRSPGGYTGKIDVKLTPRMPAAAALAAVLTALVDTLEANVNGTVRDLDTEFLHDLRVAVRRSRSVLKLAGDVLPEGLAGRFGRELKWLGDLTTPTRDLDVYLLGYPAMAAGLIAATPEELEPFHEHLRGSREAAQGELARGLRSARFSRFLREWREALAAVTATTGSRPSVARLAAGRIARAHRRVIRHGAAINSASPPENLHELRKRCKELRYLLEIFASLYNPDEHWRAVKDLKALQDCLGTFQDTHVQHQEIRAFAAQMSAKRAAPTALLAMGEIAAELVSRQRQARGEFAARFRDFASPASQARIRALTGAAVT